MTASPPPDGRSHPSLGVVVPVYNEERGIEHGCRAIVAAVRDYPGRCVVIAVDDGSADRSAEVIAGLQSRFDRLELVRHERNGGYGAALRTGARRAQAMGLQYVAFIDSDLTNPPSDLIEIGRLAAGGHPYIKGSRFVRGGGMRGVPATRATVSRLGNLVAAALFGTRVRDVTNGFRAGRTDLICSWPTRERGFAVIVEEFAHALRSGVDIVEFPTVLSGRMEEQRGSAFSYSPHQLWAYLRYPLGFRIAQLRRLRGSTRA